MGATGKRLTMMPKKKRGGGGEKRRLLTGIKVPLHVAISRNPS